MRNQDDKEYIFGVNKAELERLRFQHGVWRGVTDAFLDKLGIGHGWKCLDAGAGPGFCTIDIRERVGEEGKVTALEPSEFYVEYLRNEVKKRGWANVALNHSTVEDAELPSQYYDLIFLRWVIAFVPDTEGFLEKLFQSLKPGGIIAIQDYNYEGLSLFPRGGAFDVMPEKVKEYYRSGGGDPYVASVIPGIFRKHGIELTEYTPVCLAGGPQSGVFQWAEKFFMIQAPKMVKDGILTANESDEMLKDWMAHKNNPDAVFFSPIVVNIIGRKTP